MTVLNKKEPLLLLAGDILFWILALWLALGARYLEIPTRGLFLDHLTPFSFLFIVWVLVFFIAGLYDRQTVILKSRLPGIIFNTQLVNSALAVIFFYLIPYYGITPKTNLFIDLLISFPLIVVWRLYLYPMLVVRKKQNGILIGSGREIRELYEEVNQNAHYNLNFISSIDLDKMETLDFQNEILNRIYTEDVSIIVIDLRNQKVEPILPHLYNMIFSNIVFIDKYKIYEDVFDRIPLSLVKYSWFLENISTSPNIVYDVLKRMMDVIISFVLLCISLVLYPFVWAAIKMDEGGSIFIYQERIGQYNKNIKIPKFKTMNVDDRGKWVGENDNRITRTGKFLRKSRIDELPQLWSVLKGDLSLIGPRPDLHDLGLTLTKEIPYYTIRNIIKPGLSGWAQIKQDLPPQSIEETRMRLAYDLYYIKNRSFILDIKIALKTIKTLISRSGK